MKNFRTGRFRKRLSGMAEAGTLRLRGVPKKKKRVVVDGNIVEDDDNDDDETVWLQMLEMLDV